MKFEIPFSKIVKHLQQLPTNDAAGAAAAAHVYIQNHTVPTHKLVKVKLNEKQDFVLDFCSNHSNVKSTLTVFKHEQ